MPSTNVFNEMCVKITLLRYITKNLTKVCNVVYFRLCIDLMNITPPFTAEGYDGSLHPRYAEWIKGVTSITHNAQVRITKYGNQNRTSHRSNHKACIYFSLCLRVFSNKMNHALVKGSFMQHCDVLCQVRHLVKAMNYLIFKILLIAIDWNF